MATLTRVHQASPAISLLDPTPLSLGSSWSKSSAGAVPPHHPDLHEGPRHTLDARQFPRRHDHRAIVDGRSPSHKILLAPAAAATRMTGPCATTEQCEYNWGISGILLQDAHSSRPGCECSSNPSELSQFYSHSQDTPSWRFRVAGAPAQRIDRAAPAPRIRHRVARLNPASGS